MAFAIGAAVSAAGAIGGSLISSSANSKAAKTQANAIAEAARIQDAANARAQDQRNRAVSDAGERADRIINRQSEAERVAREEGDAGFAESADLLQLGANRGINALQLGGDRGITAITAGRDQATSLLQPIINDAPDTYSPGFRLGLTPNQTIAREDLLRRARGVVAASGLRGAGRGGVATIIDADRRFLAGAADTNDGLNREAERTNLTLRSNQRQRADSARTALASSAMTTGQSLANLETNRGQGIAAIETNRGQALAANQRGRAEARAASSRREGQNYADTNKWVSNLAVNASNQNANSTEQNADDQARARTGIGSVNANAGTANAGLSADIVGRIGAMGGDYLERYMKANSGPSFAMSPEGAKVPVVDSFTVA